MTYSNLALLSVIAGPFISGCIATLLFGKKSSYLRRPGLLFHSVLPDPGLNLSHFSSGKFKKLLSTLQENSMRTTTVADYAASSERDTTVCLTFDDGLESVYSHAFPAMEEHGCKATIFCVAGYLGKKTSWDVFNTHHMNKMQIQHLSDCGHEIGSHSLSHANLPYLCERDLAAELTDSKALLEDITGRPVTSLSFPHGSWNKRVWEKACEAGYVTATIYRGYTSAIPAFIPVFGAYRFDTVGTILQRIAPSPLFSVSRACSRILPHFARGTPVWKFRDNYRLFPK